MFRGFSVSLNPIGPWAVLVAAAVVVLFLTLWAYAQAPQFERRLAVGGAGPAAAGSSALPAGGAAAQRDPPGEEAAGRDDRLPAGFQHQHDPERRGQGSDPVGRGAEGHGAGARGRQVAGTEPRGQGVSVRRHPQGGQARGTRRRARRPRDRPRLGPARRREARGTEQQADRPDGRLLRLRLEQRHQPSRRGPPPPRSADSRWSPSDWAPRPPERDPATSRCRTSPRRRPCS